MKTNRYLLPTYFKKIGWVLSIPTALTLLGYLLNFRSTYDAAPPETFMSRMFSEPYWRVVDLLGGARPVLTVAMILLMAGLLFIAFSRRKIEDEYVAKLRGDSLIWAVIVNSVLLLVCFVTVFDGWFLYVSFLNLYTLLILYIVKFEIALRHFQKSTDHEE